MSHLQNAGQNQNITTGNELFESVAKVQIFGNDTTDYINEEFNSRLNSQNACYHTVHNRLSSYLLRRNTKTKMYRTVYDGAGSAVKTQLLRW
jgi:hypothetical protein